MKRQSLTGTGALAVAIPPGLSAEDPGKTIHLPVFFLKFSSLAQSCLTLATPWTTEARLFCPFPSPGACSNSCSSSQ